MKEIIKNQRKRKVMLTQVEYQLPDIDDDQFILDDEYEQEQTENTNFWLESFTGKSQYDIAESLAIAVW